MVWMLTGRVAKAEKSHVKHVKGGNGVFATLSFLILQYKYAQSGAEKTRPVYKAAFL